MKNIRFIVGDLHLGEENIFNNTYSNFFKTKEDYIDTFIKNYNSKIVNNEVEVCFLGDLGKREYIERVFPRLKGKKYLILGNHDKYSKEFYKKYFEEVFGFPVFINSRIVLSHEPIPTEPGVLNAHGHTHYIDLISDRHINLVIEKTNFEPYNIKNLIKKLYGIAKPDRRFLNEWFSDMQKVNTNIEVPSYIVVDDNNKIDVESTRRALALHRGLK